MRHYFEVDVCISCFSNAEDGGGAAGLRLGRVIPNIPSLSSHFFLPGATSPHNCTPFTHQALARTECALLSFGEAGIG